MSTRDIASDLSPWLALQATINSDTDTNGTTFDMANYDDGYMFFIKATSWTDGAYSLNLEDSPTDSVWTDVPTAKLINPDGNAPSIGAATATGDQLKRLGAFSTDRFVRAVVTSTGTSSGAVIEVYLVKKPELKPASAV